MSNSIALDPRRSVVVEACAGSGKTWLLVSRMVRLLLDGALPSQILAITFTRKAAQEMQARLQEWLHDLARGDDAFVCQFFAERGLDTLSDEQMRRARVLYESVLLAQPGITIGTFHGWFMQVLQRAPLNADVMHGMSLLERPGAEQQAAWEELLEQMRKQPGGELAQRMEWLFAEYGLHNARELLFNFLAKRAEWWAYTAHLSSPSGEGVHVVLATLDKLRADLEVDLAFDPVADWGQRGNNEEMYLAFVRQLASNGTEVQQSKAVELERTWTDNAPEWRFEKIWPLLFTQKREPRTGKPIAPSKKQNESVFLDTLVALQDSLQTVRDTLAEQQAYRLNEAVLHCGSALLERYQSLKAQKQQMDFVDLEWQLCRLLQTSEHAETMQYKLDSRYQHVLLDEFQDTNPLQWQIMRAWFDAAAAVQSQLTVFIVGDPKQSIYRFRRADARLFGVARDYLTQHFSAETLGNSLTRRNAQPIVDVVNAVFREQPHGFEFVEHQTHQKDLPGYVQVLPLSVADELPSPQRGREEEVLQLRDPLTTPRAETGEGARHKEAQQFADQLHIIARTWQVQADGETRRAQWGDIMVLVRSRTHLAIYEEALRAQHIPFISSRRGGLLDTLEAEDVQALLMFLITPFADLQLAQVLRTPIFACSDDDLMLASGLRNEELGLSGAVRVNEAEDFSQSSVQAHKSSWWQRLQQLDAPSPALQRARQLLKGWLVLADKLPVHDLLDRIYFEGDVIARYRAVLPSERRAKVVANLNAFMEIALSVDAGRYPSLPRFLQELRELRDSSDDAPDEGRLGSVGNAVRIYTVHEAKGLEAPIVWLLDAHVEKKNREGNDVLLGWSPHDERPAHFSLYTDLASRGRKRVPLFEQEAAQQAREEMNLLYVAMTRTQQALIVSGSQGGKENRSWTWYEHIAAVVDGQKMPFALSLSNDENDIPSATHSTSSGQTEGVSIQLPAITPIGKRIARNTAQQQRGIWLHALLQYLTEGTADKIELQHHLAIPAAEVESLWQQAQLLLATPQLARFFDAQQYRAAYNEMPYVNAQGELKRIDRLVEFDDEVWVLDYKLGDAEDATRYHTQMQEYRTAMQAVYAGKMIRCALVFVSGMVSEF
jgi:ATP-dependent helicase/nuclease subunit A